MLRRILPLLLTAAAFTVVHSTDAQQVDSMPIFEFKPYEPHLVEVFSFGNLSADYDIDPNPSHEDSAVYLQHIHLLHQKPTQKNYRDFYAFSRALWQLGHNTEAKEKFLQIMDCKASFYTGNYYNNSDIPGDTTSNIYGYGSYVTNYKNYACRYLTKIYLQENKPAEALKYIALADKVHTATYNCGTGNMWYRQEIDGLYGLCYLGLEQYDSIFQMFVPRYHEFYSGTLVRALKKVYSAAQIQEYLKIAENSIVCNVDTFKSATYITRNSGLANEKTDTIYYVSGAATMRLFDKQVWMVAPQLQDGQTASRELFLEQFKKSGFYRELLP